MTIQWTLYDDATGAIISTGDAMDEETANLQAIGGGRIVLVNSDPATQVVSNPTSDYPGVTIKADSPIVVDKTALTADGVDTVRISNIPANSTAQITVPPNMGVADISLQTITDGVLIITTTVKGDYTIVISSFPHATYSVILHAS